MKTTVKWAMAAALLAAPGALWAQQTPAPAGQTAAPAGQSAAPATDPNAPAADGNSPAPGELSLGKSDGTPQVGQTYIKATFTDWEERCVKTKDGKDPCQLYQLLKDQGGNSVAEISLFNLPAGQQAAAGATIITPLETLLTQDLKMSVDGGQAKRYPFSFCTKIGCFARIGLTADELAGLKKGSKAVITIVPAGAPDKTVDLNVSLSGFTAGWDAVVASNAANGN